MNRLRTLLVAVATIALMPIAAQALLQTQRSQVAVTIIINATPNPLGMLGPPAPASAIAVTARLHDAPAQVERRFEGEAQQLHFAPGGPVQIAQAAVQRSVRVEASVAPNPLGTLLYSDQNAVTVNAEAGIATAVTCAYHVTVDTTQTNWTLKHGLSNDFSDGHGHAFLGGYVANNSYIPPAAPNPTATPFVVYADNGGQWANLQVNSGMKTYCVDLTVNMPITTPGGTYSSNAIYTVYY
jgi:hypothetical protein